MLSQLPPIDVTMEIKRIFSAFGQIERIDRPNPTGNSLFIYYKSPHSAAAVLRYTEIVCKSSFFYVIHSFNRVSTAYLFL